MGFQIILFSFFLIFLKIIFILLRIAFITLFERKALGFSQLRLGPNKVTFLGLLQPVVDGLKLFLKELYFPKKLVFWGVFLGPFIGFCVILLLWLIFLKKINVRGLNFVILYVVVLVGLNVYSSLISGWRRTSKYASIGGIRSCSQSISYEISLIFLIICFLIFLNTIKILTTSFFTLLLYFIFPVFFIRCVAEINRAPFDFREGERELISGFNIEFGSSGFVLLFLAEYGIILFFSLFLSFLFFKKSFIFFVIIIFLLIFIRRVYPRFRYDILIKLMWLKILPFSLVIIFFSLVIFFFISLN